jgi:hypothetical protein
MVTDLERRDGSAFRIDDDGGVLWVDSPREFVDFIRVSL